MKHMGYTGNKRFWLSEMKVSESVFASANLPTQHLELCLLEDSSVETERMRCCLWLCGADAGDSKTSGPNTSHTHSSCSLCCGRPSTAFSRENKFTLQDTGTGYSSQSPTTKREGRSATSKCHVSVTVISFNYCSSSSSNISCCF